MRTLDDKVIALTGAGSGIGRALAVRTARGGAHLALADVNPDGLAETARLARGAGARSVTTELVDVADRKAVHVWADAVVQQHGRVNAVVNNAGVSLTGSFESLAYDDMEWIMSINFWGVVHGTKAFLPHLIASGDGHVVNVSSLFGLVSMPSQSLYNASKYAVRGMSESLREEMLVAGHPVQVTVVHPGGIRTAIADSGRYAEGQDGTRTAKHFNEKLARTSPDEAARVIVNGMLAHKARVLIGADAHAVHTLGKVLGSRYQDVAAKLSRRVLEG